MFGYRILEEPCRERGALGLSFQPYQFGVVPRGFFHFFRREVWGLCSFGVRGSGDKLMDHQTAKRWVVGYRILEEPCGERGALGLSFQPYQCVVVPRGFFQFFRRDNWGPLFIRRYDVHSVGGRSIVLEECPWSWRKVRGVGGRLLFCIFLFFVVSYGFVPMP